MKKLIMAVAIVCAAVAAQAGTIRWQVVDTMDVAGEDVFTGGGAYLFLASAFDYDEVEASIKDGTFLATYADSAIKLEFEDGELDSGNMKSDSYAGSMSFFMVALDDDTAPENYFMGEAISKNVGASGTQSYNWTYGDNTTEWTAVADVPEPTSGLLMLLGMAGLALRRRRA